MPKIICGAVDCEHNRDGYHCDADKIVLSEHSVMTVWEGRQQFWKCDQYEMSEQSKRLYEEFKRLIENDTGKNG